MKFLATTAIEEFWDKNERLLFLGEWCKLFKRRHVLDGLKYDEVPFLWDQSEVVLEKRLYCDRVYKQTLVSLTQLLNEYHEIDKDIKYYEIILGPWLIHFIDQLYDKYSAIKKVFSEYDRITTWILDETQYYIPLDYNDYAKKRVMDEYALQIYSQIIRIWHKFPIKKLSNPLIQYHKYSTFDSRRPPKYIIFDHFLKIMAAVSQKLYSKTIMITGPYFSYNILNAHLTLLWKSKMRIIFNDMQYKGFYKNFCLDSDVRKKQLFDSSGDEFEHIVSMTVLSNIPVLYLELLSDFREFVLELPIVKSKAFFTANSLYGNEIFKFFVSEHYRTIKLFGGQHGGGYGLDYINRPEEHERSVCDIFYTAGWRKDKKTIPMSVAKFSFNKSSKRGDINKILLVMNEMPRYLYRFHFQAISSQYLYYVLNPTLEFLSLCNNRKMITIRSYPQHLHGWDTYERIQEHFDDCYFDDFSLSFNEQMIRSKILVLTCAHTTYLEALAANKPTIMFLNKKINCFHPDAVPYFTNLEKAKILHWSPESAAYHLNAVYENVDSWWNEDDVQEARRLFVDKYALSSPSWADEWVREFNRVLENEC